MTTSGPTTAPPPPPARATPEMVVAGRTLAEPRLSPDGTCVVAQVRDGAGSRLIRIDLGGGLLTHGGPEILLTCHPEIVGVHPSGGGSWNWFPDGSGIVYVCAEGLAIVAREGGIGRLVAASPDGGSFVSPTVAPDGRTIAVVVETDETQSLVLISVHGDDQLSEGTALNSLFNVVHGDPAVFRMDPQWGPDGSLVWHEWRAPAMPWTNSTVVRAQVEGNGSPDLPFSVTWAPIGPDLGAGWGAGAGAGLAGAGLAGGSVPSMVAQPQISPDGTRLGLISDASTGWANVCVDGRPVVADGAGEAFEHGTPSWGPGQRSWCWSPDGASVAFVRNERGFATLCTADLTTGTVRELGRAWHIGLSWGRTASGHERIAAIRSGGITPTQLVVYDLSGPVADGARVPRTTVARGPIGGWERLGLPEPEVVEWHAADGTLLHGRLYPAIASERPSETWTETSADAAVSVAPGVIVSCHGGPTDQTTVTFNPRFAYWMSQGWSVFVPDHRGSTGWGRAYQQAMDGLWGVLDVSDVADGVRWLMGTGRVDPTRAVAMGGSAGGFCALHLLVANANLFACGVALYPVTDLAELDATTHRFERSYSATLVGPPSTYRSRSPITDASTLRRPLLLMHGDSDPVVTVGQSRSYLVGAQQGGADVELAVFEGEGHGWKKPESTVDELRRIDDFLHHHVPAR